MHYPVHQQTNLIQLGAINSCYTNEETDALLENLPKIRAQVSS